LTQREATFPMPKAAEMRDTKAVDQFLRAGHEPQLQDRARRRGLAAGRREWRSAEGAVEVGVDFEPALSWRLETVNLGQF
jgi:hypothetical protein